MVGNELGEEVGAGTGTEEGFEVGSALGGRLIVGRGDGLVVGTDEIEGKGVGSDVGLPSTILT